MGRVCEVAPAGSEGGQGQSHRLHPLALCHSRGPPHTHAASLGVQTGGSTRSHPPHPGCGSLGTALVDASPDPLLGLAPAGTAPSPGTAPHPSTPRSRDGRWHCHCPSHPPHPSQTPPPAPAVGRAPAARTLQTDVIRVLMVIKQGCVIPKEFRISPTFVAPHRAHRGGRAQGRLRLRQLGTGHQVAELHLGLLRHGRFSQGLPIGLRLRAQLRSR